MLCAFESDTEIRKHKIKIIFEKVLSSSSSSYPILRSLDDYIYYEQ